MRCWAAAGDFTLTAQYREALGVRVINAAVPGRTMTLPVVERYDIVSVNTAISTEDVSS